MDGGSDHFVLSILFHPLTSPDGWCSEVVLVITCWYVTRRRLASAGDYIKSRANMPDWRRTVVAWMDETAIYPDTIQMVLKQLQVPGA